jgi:hypothetical protein
MINNISITALIEAGHITEDDNTLGILQNLDLPTAEGIADWLCLATQTTVKLRYMSLVDGVHHIERTPQQLDERLHKR